MKQQTSGVGLLQTNSSRSLQSNKSDNTAEGQQSSVSAQLSALYGTTVLPVLPLELLPSDTFLPDDFLTPYDSYEYQPPQKKQQREESRPRTRRSLRRKSSRIPRLAGFGQFLGYASKNTNENGDNNSFDDEDGAGDSNGETMTTPLHEAARLGSHEFVRALLDWGGDPNIKNHSGRTALHMVAGGLTASEEKLVCASEISSHRVNNSKRESPSDEDDNDEKEAIQQPGIRAPVVPLFDAINADEESRKAYHGMTKLRSVGRLIKSALRSSKTEAPSTQAPETVTSEEPLTQPDPEQLGKLKTERMEAAISILSWTDPKTGEGPSINAVDSMGRTALHYAAELGRDDVCMAILSKYDAILTIVDELGATPCELAAEQDHPDLAAHLEARAILYCDPFGADDDMMAAVLAAVADGPNGNSLGQDNEASLVPPFGWFDTLSTEQAGEERTKRLQVGLKKMRNAIERRAVEANPKEAINSATNSPVARAKPLDEQNEPDNSADEPDTSAFEGANNAGDKSFGHLEESHVELFLSYHKWNVRAAIAAFRKDPFSSFKDAGIPVPSGPKSIDSGQSPFWKSAGEEDLGSKDVFSQSGICLICYDDQVDDSEWRQLAGCGHGFCSGCLRDYITDCAGRKTTGLCLPCPHHECQVPISPSLVSELLSSSPEVYARLTDAAVEKFISSAFDMRFCPHPGCSGVVLRKDDPSVSMGFDSEFLDFVGAVCTHASDPRISDDSNDDKRCTYEGVCDLEYFNCRSVRQPRKAHRFCFACGEDPHWPVACERLEAWKCKVHKELEGLNDGTNDGNGGRNFDDLAQKLWIKANTRPCPQVRPDLAPNNLNFPALIPSIFANFPRNSAMSP